MSSLLLILLVFSAVLSAQIDRGGTAGTIADPSGAMIPGAAITITNQAPKSTAHGLFQHAGQHFRYPDCERRQAPCTSQCVRLELRGSEREGQPAL